MSDTKGINEGNTLKDSHVAECGVDVKFKGGGVRKVRAEDISSTKVQILNSPAAAS